MSEPWDNEPTRSLGVLQPANCSFEAVNAFVNHPDVSFEELQWALLSIASAIERDYTRKED